MIKDKSPNNRKITTKTVKDLLPWFEIAVLDVERAKSFYEAVFNVKMKVIESDEFTLVLFPTSKGSKGALIKKEGCVPSVTGALIYLQTGKNMDRKLEKARRSGGFVILPKTKITGGSGYYALIIDTEGNKIGLYSKK